jgi:hypothetical protein
MTAYFWWRVILRFCSGESSKRVALGMATALALVIGAEGRTWGGWVLNCTPEEYAAAEWIRRHTAPSDFIIANWYTGDYVRSLSKRNIIISDYPRIEVRVAKEKFNLNIPILPRDPQKVVEYVEQHPGTYYLLVSKWGPWGNYGAEPHFELLQTFGENPKTQAKLFKINVDERN